MYPLIQHSIKKRNLCPTLHLAQTLAAFILFLCFKDMLCQRKLFRVKLKLREWRWEVEKYIKSQLRILKFKMATDNFSLMVLLYGSWVNLFQSDRQNCKRHRGLWGTKVNKHCALSINFIIIRESRKLGHCQFNMHLELYSHLWWCTQIVFQALIFTHICKRNPTFHI